MFYMGGLVGWGWVEWGRVVRSGLHAGKAALQMSAGIMNFSMTMTCMGMKCLWTVGTHRGCSAVHQCCSRKSRASAWNTGSSMYISIHSIPSMHSSQVKLGIGSYLLASKKYLHPGVGPAGAHGLAHVLGAVLAG